MFLGGCVLAVLGTKLSGLEQSLKSKKPVYLGDTITSTVMVKVINSYKDIYGIEIVVHNQDGAIEMEGYALVMN